MKQFHSNVCGKHQQTEQVNHCRWSGCIVSGVFFLFSLLFSSLKFHTNGIFKVNFFSLNYIIFWKNHFLHPLWNKKQKKKTIAFSCWFLSIFIVAKAIQMVSEGHCTHFVQYFPHLVHMKLWRVNGHAEGDNKWTTNASSSTTNNNSQCN